MVTFIVVGLSFSVEIEQVVKEFLKLLGLEKIKEAEELIVGEARVRENEVARHFVENRAKLNEGGLYAGALHCFEAARKIVRSEDLRGMIDQCLAMTHNNFAVLLENKKKYEEAENHYTEALRINPQFAEAHNNYANMLKIMKRYKEAENHTKRSSK